MFQDQMLILGLSATNSASWIPLLLCLPLTWSRILQGDEVLFEIITLLLKTYSQLHVLDGVITINRGESL